MVKILSCVIYLTICVCVNSENVNLIAKWRDFPFKMFTNTTMLQPRCQSAFKNFLEMINKGEMHALKMFDATAKLPSGILSGNVVQYGDFNECLEVPNAQYCLVEIDLDHLWMQPYLKYKNLVHSYYFFKENFSDPAHRVPGFSMVRWGFCIPQECRSSDLEKSLTENFGIRAQIRPGMCQTRTRNSDKFTIGDYIARIFFASIFIAVCMASFVDYFKMSFSKGISSKNVILYTFHELLMSFSLQRNILKFLDLKKDPKEIPGLHGIRALNALGLLMSHKAISVFFNPLMNRTSTVNKITSPWTIIAKNAIVYTDSFMLLSGLLNANALLTDLNNGKTMNYKDKLINRIFRILPNLVALILFCTYILPSMSSGPLWPTIVVYHSHLCKKYMWRNILFIHNYFGFENMCLTHTHQLGIDMQLFLLTPFLIYLIWNYKHIGFLTLLVTAIISTVLRFWIAHENELTSVVYFGISISKMFETANLSYILPTHRATIYLMGVYLAYFLKRSNRSLRLSMLQTVSLWMLFLPMFLWSWLGQYHMVQKDYVYSRLEGSLVNAISPILWGASISFGIYAIHKNIAGWLGKLLCWKYFQYVTKLSYAIYLIQFPVFFYNVGVTKHVDEYHPQFLLQVMETSAIIFCSLILVLCVEIPFQNIKKVLFDGQKCNQNTTKISVNSNIHLQRKQFKCG